MRVLKRVLKWLGIGLAVLVLALTAASLAFNAVTSGRDVAASKLYRGPYADVDGTRLSYRTWGWRGSPILLLGGFVEPSWVWHDVGPELGRSHRVYALDLPPFGFSERRGPYTIARWTALVAGFEQRERLTKPLVVGHSLGAAVVVSLATHAPRSVGGIVLLDGDALPGSAGAAWLSHLLVPPWYTTLYRIATDWDWLLRRALKSAWGSGRPPFTGEFVEQWEQPFRVSGTAAAYASLLGHGIQGVPVSTIKQVRVPALVVWGAQDTVDPVAAGRRTARLLHSRFVEIAGAGHLSMLERPRAVARAIELAGSQ